MQYVIIGVGSIAALAISDGIENTEWYTENFWKPDGQNVTQEQWYGYAFRYGVGTAVVLGSVALAAAVA